MKEKEIAVKYFGSGFNCSQSVLATFGPELGMDKITCLKLATGFGGGMGRMQNVCGAVTGAIMAIGLKYGNSQEEKRELNSFTYEKVLQFVDEFKKRNESIECIDILGYDMKTDEGMEMINKKNLYATTCLKCVQDSVEIVKKMFEKDK